MKYLCISGTTGFVTFLDLTDDQLSETTLAGGIVIRVVDGEYEHYNYHTASWNRAETFPYYLT